MIITAGRVTARIMRTRLAHYAMVASVLAAGSAFWFDVIELVRHVH
jgi:hypothetical protein